MKKTIWKLGSGLAAGLIISFNAAADYSKSFEGYGLFKANCAICHGADGTGNGILAKRLETRPTNLTDPSLANKSDRDIFRLIEGTATHGKDAEKMPQWGLAIPQTHINSLVSYIRYLHTSKYQTTGNPIKGKEVYDESCIACHGKNGKGDGILAKVYHMTTADHTNSMQMNRLTNKALKAYINFGEDGTMMPGWKGEITNEQVEDVISYIRLLSANGK